MYVARAAILIPLALITTCSGCSSLGQQDDALAAYEATRREIDGEEIQHVAYEDQVADDTLTVDDFTPGNLTQTVKQMTGNGPNPTEAKRLYAQAQAEYRRATQAREQNLPSHTEMLLAAAEAFAAAAERWPQSTLEHDALFMAGECYFFADRYPKSEEFYERLLKAYPHSKHLDRIQPRRFEIARYWLGLEESAPKYFYEMNLSDVSRPRLDTFGHAVRVLDRIRLDDPTGKLADDATLSLGLAFFTRGKFLRADEYFTDLRKTFPSSEHQFSAHFLGLKAKLMAYQGPDYSANALNEAEKLLKQIQRQFPADVQREREYLARAGAEIRYRLAEREWELAEHYDRRAEFGAARFHYQTIVDDYPGTRFANGSQARLREIDGLPPTPPQRLSWLVDLFPEDEAVQPLIATDPAGTTRR